MFNPGLKIGQIVKNADIVEIFKCGNMGGMRRSRTTNTLVIVSDYTKGLYHDKWIGGVLHYTGMGKSGDQDLYWSQNATLAESSFIFFAILIRAPGWAFCCTSAAALPTAPHAGSIGLASPGYRIFCHFQTYAPQPLPFAALPDFPDHPVRLIDFLGASYIFLPHMLRLLCAS